MLFFRVFVFGFVHGNDMLKVSKLVGVCVMAVRNLSFDSATSTDV